MVVLSLLLRQPPFLHAHLTADLLNAALISEKSARAAY